MNHGTASLLEKARQSYQNKDWAKASYLLEEILEGDSQCSEAYFMLANMAHMRGEIGKALKAFRKVLSIEPEHTDASVALSVLLNDIGKYQEAQKVFDNAKARIKKRDRGFIDPHINKTFALKHAELGEMYFSYQRYEEALFELNKAIRLDPEYLKGRIRIAKIFHKLGHSQKAHQELRKLKNEHPRFIDGLLALGLYYYSEGKVLEAQSEWQQVLKYGPDNRDAQMYLDMSRTASQTSISS